MITIVYFGTNEFSARVLDSLVATQGFKVLAVITQPARPAGRDQAPAQSPVKLMAEKLHLPILEPESLKNFSINSLPPADIFVVYAYGSIIPQNILNLPKHGALNIHPSLLPKYRGPTPVQTALINGENATGVSIILLDKAMDHGPIVAQIKQKIAPDDTANDLTKKLIEEAAPLLIKIIPDWIDKKITPTVQDDSQATFCKMFTRDDGKIDWTNSAAEIYNRYRALTPWPGIWTIWNGKRLKLLRIVPSPARRGVGGEVGFEEGRLFITCADNSLEILQLQLEGKKPMSPKEFINGYLNFANAILV